MIRMAAESAEDPSAIEDDITEMEKQGDFDEREEDDEGQSSGQDDTVSVVLTGRRRAASSIGTKIRPAKRNASAMSSLEMPCGACQIETSF